MVFRELLCLQIGQKCKWNNHQSLYYIVRSSHPFHKHICRLSDYIDIYTDILVNLDSYGTKTSGPGSGLKTWLENDWNVIGLDKCVCWSSHWNYNVCNMAGWSPIIKIVCASNWYWSVRLVMRPIRLL